MNKVILVTFFSIFLLFGCKTTGDTINTSPEVTKAWVKPEKPTLEQPKFEREGEKLYLDNKNAVLLRNNLVEMKAYEEKLEFLVDELLNYYTK